MWASTFALLNGVQRLATALGNGDFPAAKELLLLLLLLLLLPFACDIWQLCR
jgi:hypothetical protein